MKYEFKSRVRYSEIGEDRKLTLDGILNYFQDCTTFHSEEVGLGMERLEEKRRVWMLSAWQICAERYPVLGEQLTVQTWPYDFKGFYGMRNFALRNEVGELLAWANSLWVYVNLDTGRPARVDAEELSGYVLEPRLDMKYEDRKVAVPAGGRQMESFEVKKHHLDTNHHVNNGQYIRMAEEYLPGDFRVRQMRAEYKNQARLGDRICPFVCREDGKYVVTLSDTEGKPYCIAEFK